MFASSCLKAPPGSPLAPVSREEAEFWRVRLEAATSWSETAKFFKALPGVIQELFPSKIYQRFEKRKVQQVIIFYGKG